MDAKSVHDWYFSHLDYTSTPVHVKILIISIGFWLAICLLSLILFSRNKVHRRLRAAEKIFWHTTVVRGVFGIFCMWIGATTIFGDQSVFKKDFLYGKHSYLQFSTLVAVGFLLLKRL